MTSTRRRLGARGARVTTRHTAAEELLVRRQGAAAPFSRIGRRKIRLLDNLFSLRGLSTAAPGSFITRRGHFVDIDFKMMRFLKCLRILAMRHLITEPE